jgi:hypothetical protein
MNGGAVSEERSPENDVILYICKQLARIYSHLLELYTFRNEDQLLWAEAGTAAPS